MSDYAIKSETLTGIADAIRVKNGKTDQIPTTSMAEEILAIETEVVLQDKTVDPTTTQQIVEPDTGYDGLGKVTVNAVSTVEQATPSVTVDSSGLITASATQEAGYVAAGTKSATEQLTTQGAQTITPGTSSQTISAGRYLTGAQTIKGDSNLKAGNILSGVTIFGVTGTVEKGVTVQKKSGTFTTDANGEASINCGFYPDCVYINGGSSAASPNRIAHTGVMFTEGSTSYPCILVPSVDEYFRYTILWFERTSNGFTVDAEKQLHVNGLHSEVESYRTFNYTAIKYT